MKAKKTPLTKPSEPDKVDAYMQLLKHPLAEVVEALRRVILSTTMRSGKRSSGTRLHFSTREKMKPFNPKEHKRYIVVFNLYRIDCIRLVFPRGARVKDKSGLLEGDYPDGRRLALFSSVGDVKAKKAALQSVIRRWLETLDKN